MPIYKVRLEREYVTRESVDVEVEAENDDAARKEALALAADEAIEDDWSEVDGGPREAEVRSVALVSETNDVIVTGD